VAVSQRSELLAYGRIGQFTAALESKKYHLGIVCEYADIFANKTDC
jgi:hypothetical protein